MKQWACLLLVVFILGVLYLVPPFNQKLWYNQSYVIVNDDTANVTENVRKGHEESINDIMWRRKSILRLSCDYWSELLSVQATGTHDELLSFHSKIHNLTFPAKHSAKANLPHSAARAYKK